jgi:hypothetical protein
VPILSGPIDVPQPPGSSPHGRHHRDRARAAPAAGLTCGVVLGSHHWMLAVAADLPLAAALALPAEILGDWPVPDFQPISEQICQLIIPEHTPAGRPVRRHPAPVATIAEAS